MTVKTLHSIRDDESFLAFWSTVIGKIAATEGVQGPKLQRKKRMSARFETGRVAPEYPENVEVYFRQIYCQCIDSVAHFIEEIFDQPDYRIYKEPRMRLLRASNEMTRDTNTPNARTKPRYYC